MWRMRTLAPLTLHACPMATTAYSRAPEQRTVRVTFTHPDLPLRLLLENPAQCEIHVPASQLQRIFLRHSTPTTPGTRVVRFTTISAQLVTPATDRRFSRAPLIITLSSPPWNPPSFTRSATPPSAQPVFWADVGSHWLCSGVQGLTTPVMGALLAHDRDTLFYDAPDPTDDEMAWAKAMEEKDVPTRVPPTETPWTSYWHKSMHELWPTLNRHQHVRLSSVTPDADAIANLVQACVDKHMPAARYFLNTQAPLTLRFQWPDAEWEAIRFRAQREPHILGPTALVTATFTFWTL